MRVFDPIGQGRLSARVAEIGGLAIATRSRADTALLDLPAISSGIVDGVPGGVKRSVDGLVALNRGTRSVRRFDEAGGGAGMGVDAARA